MAFSFWSLLVIPIPCRKGPAGPEFSGSRLPGPHRLLPFRIDVFLSWPLQSFLSLLVTKTLSFVILCFYLKTFF